MEHLNSTIMFIGRNIKIFFISVLLRFIIFNLMLAISVLVFFLAGHLFRDPVYIVMIFLIILILNHFVNHKVLRKHTFTLMEKYSDESVRGNIKIKNRSDLRNKMKNRVEIKHLLSSPAFLMLPVKFYFSLSFILNKYETGNHFHKKEIKNLLLEHYKQIMKELLITLTLSLPFFLISLVFTAGYRSELVVLSMILALIFVLFIKSALITPIFYLITFKKLFQRIES